MDIDFKTWAARLFEEVAQAPTADHMEAILEEHLRKAFFRGASPYIKADAHSTRPSYYKFD